VKTIRHILDGPEEEALELAYKLAAQMMDRPITPEQQRLAWEEK